MRFQHNSIIEIAKHYSAMNSLIVHVGHVDNTR